MRIPALAIHFTALLCAGIASAAAPCWRCGVADPAFRFRRSVMDDAKQLSWQSAHFDLYYTTTGTHATTFSFVTNAAGYLEQSLAYEVDTLGYRRPVNLQHGELLPVYFAYLGENIAGYADVSSNDRAYIILSPMMADQTNWPVGMVLSTTCAHELFHTIQYAYTRYEALWWMEGTAVWMENKAFPGAHTYTRMSNRLSAFCARPNSALQSRTYDACIVPVYLDEEKGEDIVKKTWKRCGKTTSLRALRRSVRGSGRGWYKFWARFAAACYTKQFASFDSMPDIAVIERFTSASIAETAADTSSSNGLYALGLHCYEIDPVPEKLDGRLRVKVRRKGTRISTVFLLRRTDGTWRVRHRLGSRRARLNVRRFGTRYDKLCFIVFAAGSADYHTPIPYTFEYRIE